MFDDVTAGQAAPDSAASDRLSAVFVAYQGRVQHYIHHRLDRRDWHLAEDLTSEVFLRLVRDYADREIDARVLGLLRTLARHAIADHYRLRRNGETAVDFSDTVQARRLEAEYPAEDVAIANATVLARLAEYPTPVTVAVAA